MKNQRNYFIVVDLFNIDEPKIYDSIKLIADDFGYKYTTLYNYCYYKRAMDSRYLIKMIKITPENVEKIMKGEF